MPALRRISHQLEQLAVDTDRLLGERHELARLDGEIPALRHRRGERLARIGVVQRGRLVARLGGRALRAQPAPDVELPGDADVGRLAVDVAVVILVVVVRAPSCAPTRGSIGAPTTITVCCAIATWPRPLPQVGLFAIASATIAVERRVVERLQPVVGHCAAARIGLPGGRDARCRRQRLLDDLGVRRRSISAQPASSRRRAMRSGGARIIRRTDTAS